jgi:tRNA (guanine-N7-)-methyltransferase
VALEKLDKIVPLAVKDAEPLNPANLRFIHANARHLSEIFAEGELDAIHINFPDPWRNKTGWFKRRLTHRAFLETYKTLLAPNGKIHFKTDDEHLYKFSLTEFSATDFILGDYEPQNIPTNYENRFITLGKQIHRLTAQKRQG